MKNLTKKLKKSSDETFLDENERTINFWQWNFKNETSKNIIEILVIS